jgi:hypothetical protein
MDALTRLRELEAKANKGPWFYRTCYGVATIECEQEEIAHAVEYIKKHDADLICAARNLLPAFLDLLEFLDSEDDFNEVKLWDIFHTIKQTIEKELGK